MDTKHLKNRSTELDWFDFETRMRDVIDELIEPVIKRASEDREQALNCQRQITENSKRLEVLEGIVLNTGRKASIFEEI